MDTAQHYTEQAPIYGTCHDLQYYNFNSTDIAIAGCACLEGTYLDDDGDCVPPEECPCYDDYTGIMKNPGEISRRGCANW
jgi:hypothetical protein